MTEPEPLLVERPDGLKRPSAMHARAFLGLVRAGEAVERALDSQLKAAHGISLRGFEILLHLAHFAPEGHLQMTQLIAQAPLSQSRVSRLVTELETAGFVRRMASEGDSRCVAVAITERGVDMLREAQDTHYEGLETYLFSRLDWHDVTELARLAAKILE